MKDLRTLVKEIQVVFQLTEIRRRLKVTDYDFNIPQLSQETRLRSTDSAVHGLQL